MAEFTPADEIGDWAIASGLELVKARLDGRSLYPMLHAARNPQAVWELLVTVGRSVASILRPQGTDELGPIGAGSGRVAAVVDRAAGAHPMADIMTIAVTAAQLIGCAARDDFPMVRALAAAVVAGDDERMARAHLVLRAMLEILATEPIITHDPQEPS